MPNQPDYLSSAEVCEMLGIDRSTLSRWVQLKRVKPAMRIGGNRAFMFRPAEIARLRDSLTESASAP